MLYECYGGITYDDKNGTKGFDCAHFEDITIFGFKNPFESKNATFKLSEFVHIECRNAIDTHLEKLYHKIYKNLKLY